MSDSGKQQLKPSWRKVAPGHYVCDALSIEAVRTVVGGAYEAQHVQWEMRSAYANGAFATLDEIKGVVQEIIDAAHRSVHGRLYAMPSQRRFPREVADEMWAAKP